MLHFAKARDLMSYSVGAILRSIERSIAGLAAECEVALVVGR